MGLCEFRVFSCKQQKGKLGLIQYFVTNFRTVLINHSVYSGLLNLLSGKCCITCVCRSMDYITSFVWFLAPLNLCLPQLSGWSIQGCPFKQSMDQIHHGSPWTRGQRDELTQENISGILIFIDLKKKPLIVQNGISFLKVLKLSILAQKSFTGFKGF